MKATNPLRDQILSLPKLIQEIGKQFEDLGRMIVPTPEVINMRQLYLVGCGDSYMAASNSEMSFLSMANIDTRALISMQASRYVGSVYLQEPHKNIMAVGVSSSGTVSRTVEAIRAFANQGCATLALTAKEDSPLAKESNYILNTSIASFPFAPGMRSYVASQLALYLLAVRFGEIKSVISMDTAAARRKELYGYASIIEDSVAVTEEKLKQFAGVCKEKQSVLFLGSGPNRATADFGIAKVIEALGHQTKAQDIEEFGHLEFFTLEPEDLPVVIIAPSKSRAISRYLEVADIIKALGRPYIIITDDVTAFAKHTESCVAVTQVLREEFSPLAFAPLCALLVAHMGGTPEMFFRNDRKLWQDMKFVDIWSSARMEEKNENV